MTNVYEWVKAEVEREGALAPVLEIGSLNVNGSVRDLFPEPYVGLDMQEGPGVDVVADIVTEGWYRALNKLCVIEDCDAPGHRFSTVVSTETLEHVRFPWVAIERMFDALDPGGLVLITVPWEFVYHPYPDDYWRISHTGLAMLLEEYGFVDIETSSATSHTFGKARRP